MPNRRNIVKTIHSSMLNTARLFKLDYQPLPNSTLNAYHNIVTQSSNEDYGIGHFIIGLASLDLFNGNALNLSTIEHQPYDSNVILPIPVFMKPTTESITATERLKYKLFTTLTVEGITYNVAYAKNIEQITNKEPYYITYDDNNGYSISLLEGKNLDYLHPVNTIGSITYPNKLSFVSHATNVEVRLTEDEMRNIRDYIDLLYPLRTGANKYRLQEIGLVQSQYTTLNDPSEIINAQVAYFDVITDKDLSKPYLKISIDIGNMLPIQVDSND